MSLFKKKKILDCSWLAAFFPEFLCLHIHLSSCWDTGTARGSPWRCWMPKSCSSTSPQRGCPWGSCSHCKFPSGMSILKPLTPNSQLMEGGVNKGGMGGTEWPNWIWVYNLQHLYVTCLPVKSTVLVFSQCCCLVLSESEMAGNDDLPSNLLCGKEVNNFSLKKKSVFLVFDFFQSLQRSTIA